VWTTYGPALYHVLDWIFWVTGPSVLAARTLFAALIALSAVLAYRLARRFVPPSSRFAVLRWHRVSEGERVDHIAAREQIDAEAFWRIGDANDAMRPEELTVPVGRLLRIPLPEGFPGPPSP